MKKTLLSIMIGSALLFSACKKNDNNSGATDVNSSGQSVKAKSIALYEMAKENGDPYTAIVALNEVIFEDTSDIQYYDSLARMYVQSGQYTVAIIMGEKVMEAQPENYKMLEVIALCKQLSSDLTGAKEEFTKLYKHKDDVVYLYHLASLDARLGNFDQSLKQVNEALAVEGIDNEEIQFLLPDGSGTQTVSLRAALHYTNANIYANRENLSLASTELKKALKADPQFQAAQILLQQIQQYQEQQAAYNERLKAQQKFQNRFGE